MSIFDPNTIVADHLIQISTVFRPGKQAIMGAFHVWKKGGWFGNADEMLKFCSGSGCMGVLSDSFSLTEQEQERIGEENLDSVTKWPNDLQIKYEYWYELPVACPCGKTVCAREYLPDSYGFNMSPDKIGDRAEELFNMLERNADIYLVVTKEDMLIHKARHDLQTHGDTKSYWSKLGHARDRELVFYPLKRIISDLAGGTSLSSRIKALLVA